MLNVLCSRSWLYNEKQAAAASATISLFVPHPLICTIKKKQKKIRQRNKIKLWQREQINDQIVAFGGEKMRVLSRKIGLYLYLSYLIVLSIIIIYSYYNKIKRWRLCVIVFFKSPKDDVPFPDIRWQSLKVVVKTCDLEFSSYVLLLLLFTPPIFVNINRYYTTNKPVFLKVDQIETNTNSGDEWNRSGGTKIN